jgi:hypothetical protein
MCNKDIGYLIFNVNLLGTQILNLSKYPKFLSCYSFVHSIANVDIALYLCIDYVIGF